MPAALIATLYIVGYGLTAVGVVLLLVRTPRAIRAIESETERIEQRVNGEYRSRLDAMAVEFNGDLDREMGELRHSLFEQARIPYSGGLSFGGPGHKPMMLTLERVWRANIPNTIVAVSGGLLSTIASVWSLYI